MLPVRLTDEQLDAIFRAAQPLAVGDRGAFLQEVAAALQGRSEIGGDDVYRVFAEAQHRHHDPPLMGHEGHRAAMRGR
jgi:hypothetical protein